MSKTNVSKIEYQKFCDMVLNSETGEVGKKDCYEAVQVEEDVGFVKLWVEKLIEMLNSFGSANDGTAAYLFSKVGKNNIIITTQKKVSEATGISLSQVNRTFKILKNLQVICQVSPGVLMLNPRFYAYGSTKKRANLLKEFDEYYLKNLSKRIYKEAK